MPSPPPAAGRHRSGLLVIILLSTIFFALLALIVFSAGRKKNDGPPRQTETLTVLAPRIRLRTEPTAKSPVVTNAIAGEQLLLIEDRGAWVRVQNHEGLAGWAERSGLERTAERERRLARYAAIRKLPVLRGESTERATLYAGPGIFYPIVGELPDETEVQVFTRDHDFYAIDHMGQVAYVDVDAIDVTAAGARQFDVATAPTMPEPDVPPTDTGFPVPTETAPLPPPESLPEPSPVPPAERGIYAVVPPGGTQPEEIDRVIPRYPAQARMARTSGAVVLRGVVRRDGTIDDVEIIKDLPNGLGEAARDAVRRWRFRPATYRGEPIDVFYTVRVNFRLQ
ncbi:MAG TPA: TonB family protein [Thermoanaerobaculia bacterium]|nr:TonB family protein [Thermoanaerobaculia bacterium]